MYRFDANGQLTMLELEAAEGTGALPKRRPGRPDSELVSIPYFHLDLVSGSVDLFGVFTMMLAFSALLSVPYQLVPKQIIGAAFAVLNIGAFVGGIISPQLVSLFAQPTSYLYSFICLSVCMIISGACALFVKKPVEIVGGTENE